MEITNDARDKLKSYFQENSGSGIRVFMAGYGWSSPQIGLALDEPKQEDTVTTINEIQVAIDSAIEAYTDGLTLDFNKDRNSFVLVGNQSDCC